MNDIILQHPVHTLDNMELLPKGSIFTMESIHNVISSKKEMKFEKCLLLQYNSVQKDISHQLSISPYNVIFSEDDIIRLSKVMKNVHVFVPFIDVLDYFKKNDFYTYRHFLVVFALTTLLTDDLITDKETRNNLFTSGPYHDFGKICVPLSILRKEEPLTAVELTILRQHTIAGYILLSYYQHDPNHITAQVALNHHERRDGSGYPRHIRDIDFVTDIVAVCDVYDALISKRPYRPVSYENRTALEEITEMAKRGKLNWNVVRALIGRNRKQKKAFHDIEISNEKRGTPPSDNVYNIIKEE